MSDEHVILEGKVMWAFLDKPNHFDYYGLFLIPNKKSLQLVKENNFYNFKEERGHVSLQNKKLDFNIYDKENNLIMNLDYFLGNNSHVKVRCKSFIGKLVNQKCLYLESLQILKHVKIKSDINWETVWTEHYTKN